MRGAMRRRYAAAAVTLALLAVATVACDPDRGAARSPDAPPQQASATASGVEVTLRSELRDVFYTVEGASHPEILRSIARSDIAGPDAEPANGLTRSELDWSVETTARGGTCIVSLVTIELALTVTLPRHDRVGDLSADVRDAWLIFAAAVRLHEQQHTDIELAQAAVLRSDLAQLPGDCDGFELAADQTVAANRGATTSLHDAFHAREALRLATARGPLERAVARHEARLADAQSDLDDLAVRIEAIDDRFPNHVLPEPEYSEYLELQQQYNGLVVSYNSILAEIRLQTDELGWLY